MSKTATVELILIWQIPLKYADIDDVLDRLNEEGKGWVDSISAFLVDDEEENAEGGPN